MKPRAGEDDSESDEERLFRAQELVYEAMDGRSRERRIAMARAALEISPLCADAYCILASARMSDDDETLDLWRRGVDAGALAIGKDNFADFAGEFWGFIETRPYMRARCGLATALWRRGRRAEAAAHLAEMIALNPGDNMGLRYALANWHVEMDNDAALAALLAAYPEEDSTHWAWTKALAAFRREGDGKPSRAALAKARRANRHVARFLLGKRGIPVREAALIAPGGPDEAIEYARDARAPWRHSPGALEWLADAEPRAPAQAAAPVARRPGLSRRGSGSGRPGRRR